jgi:hypothetical protein
MIVIPQPSRHTLFRVSAVMRNLPKKTKLLIRSLIQPNNRRPNVFVMPITEMSNADLLGERS